MERTATTAMQSLRERIRGTWTTIDDADIDASGGSLEKLTEMISARTGRPRPEVRRDLRRIVAG